MISFNKPHLTGKETHYIYDAVQSKHISGNGKYTKLCHQYFERKLNGSKCLLTTSCTDALEMAAILLDIKQGDEVIMPSYTFVSTANAFILRGATIRFVDSRIDHPGMDEIIVEELITENTKAIVVVHYAGVAVDMDVIMDVAKKHNIFVVEDAAQSIDAFYKSKPLGSIGDMATFSFHETKNISCGEGGLLVINNPKFIDRAEIIWEKGTNRNAFFRGEVDKYGWVDIGSSFLPSELNAAFLYAQLENVEDIQQKRKSIWSYYHENLVALEKKGLIRLPSIPDYASNNAHMFYLVTNSLEERNNLLSYLKRNHVFAVFHYQSLHASPYFTNKHDGRILPNCDYYSDCLIRLPFYYSLSEKQQELVIKLMLTFFEN
jgi:dTDP-4-amino-4,6-dideoxygalactose transaminase